MFGRITKDLLADVAHLRAELEEAKTAAEEDVSRARAEAAAVDARAVAFEKAHAPVVAHVAGLVNQLVAATDPSVAPAVKALEGESVKVLQEAQALVSKALSA